MQAMISRKLIGLAFIFSVAATGALAGSVSGRVVNSQGQPLKGVKVRADHTVFKRSFMPAVTDADGRYTIKLAEPPGAWEMKAEIMREYHDEVYKIILRPDIDEAVDGDKDEVRDFTWKLTGKDSEGEPREGWVYIHPSIFDGIESKDIEITFTPDGPLIDGSEGKVIKAVFKNPLLKIVPVGRYQLKARHIPTGKPLFIQAKGADEASLDPVVMFPPSPYNKTPEQLDLDIMMKAP